MYGKYIPFCEWQRAYAKLDCKLRKKHPNFVDTRGMKEMVDKAQKHLDWVREQIELIESEIK